MEEAVTQPRESPLTQERRKTPTQKGEDVAYTINHAISCLLTDWIDPKFGSWAQRRFGGNYSFEGLSDALQSRYQKHPSRNDTLGHSRAWWVGEIAGDVGAVPLTIAVQRLFPGAMERTSRALEPLVGGMFRRSSKVGAHHWAERSGIAKDDPAVAAHADATYRYEIDHLPQALVWTGASLGINLAAQKWGMKNPAPLWVLAAGKGAGTLFSASVLLALRGLMPERMHAADHWVSTHVTTPATETLTGALGFRHTDGAQASKEVMSAEWKGVLQAPAHAQTSMVGV